jgi:hypothetical protein
MPTFVDDDAEIFSLFYFAHFVASVAKKAISKKARRGARLFVCNRVFFVAFCCLLLFDMGLCLFIPFHLALFDVV